MKHRSFLVCFSHSNKSKRIDDCEYLPSLDTGWIARRRDVKGGGGGIIIIMMKKMMKVIRMWSGGRVKRMIGN